jgi:Arm DNA-binding domain
VAFTDARIKDLKPKAARYLVTDRRGLSLDVLPSGKLSWLYRYRLNGTYDKVTLGRYPDLTLRAAREKRDELVTQVAEGKSPAVEIKRARAGVATNPTPREFGERYFEEQVMRNWKNPRDIRRYLDNEIYPTLGDKLLKDINALDVQSLLYRKRDNGHIAAAIQLRGVIKQRIIHSPPDTMSVSPTIPRASSDARKPPGNPASLG